MNLQQCWLLLFGFNYAELITLSSTFDGLQASFRHFLCMSFNTKIPDLFYAGRSVGPEDKTENSGHEIIVFFAVHGIGKRFTVSAGLILIFDITCPDSTPGGFLVIMTTRTGTFHVFTAGSTI
jgi:hypothetical protein